MSDCVSDAITRVGVKNEIMRACALVCMCESIKNLGEKFLNEERCLRSRS